MNWRARGAALLVIQCLIVSSIAAKYMYDRATRPRVWVRVAQFDPDLPLRGRYMALSPVVDACSLPHDNESAIKANDYKDGKSILIVSSWQWSVRTLARDGKLVVEDARNVVPRSSTQTIWLSADAPCERARLTPGVVFFIPDTAQLPFPVKPGEELWAEVTVPAAGSPRPIQLAISRNGEWRPLHIN
jgi:hypothetical protein